MVLEIVSLVVNHCNLMKFLSLTTQIICFTYNTWVVLQSWRWLASRVSPSSSVSCCLSSEQSTKATPTGRTGSSPQSLLLFPSIGVLQLITSTCCYRGRERRSCILIVKMVVVCEFHRCSYIINLK